MKRLTMLVNSHLLDNGKLDKEYDLNNKIQLNEYSCMDVPNAVYNKLGELEDVLEKHNIESVEELDLILQGLKNIHQENANLKQELAELKQSQKQLTIKELEKIYNLFEPYENSQKDTILCANNDISFIDYLENRIKELGGGENE